MAKKFYAETQSSGVNYLTAYGTPQTIHFNLRRELEIAYRIRPVDEAAVTKLMRSMKREGQLKPILIRVWVKDRKHARTPRLVCGAHRIEAARRLGWTHITAWLITCDDAEARQAEVDENLIRKGLPPEVEGRLMIEWCRLHGLPVPGDANDVPEAEKVVNIGHHQADVATLPTADGAGKVENIFHFPVPQQQPRPGRGHKGAIAKVADIFGVSKPTARSRIAAAQGKQRPQKTTWNQLPYDAKLIAIAHGVGKEDPILVETLDERGYRCGCARALVDLLDRKGRFQEMAEVRSNIEKQWPNKVNDKLLKYDGLAGDQHRLRDRIAARIAATDMGAATFAGPIRSTGDAAVIEACKCLQVIKDARTEREFVIALLEQLKSASSTAEATDEMRPAPADAETDAA
jgi:hypothetical protein